MRPSGLFPFGGFMELGKKKQKPVELVKMIHLDTKKRADVHPDEVMNMYKGGYRKIKQKAD